MRYLFFDLDGTLTNPAAGVIASMQHALRAMSRPPLADEELRRLIGPPLREGFRRILATDDAELIETAVGHFRERFAPIGIFENELYRGIPEALGELQADGYRMCIVTSKAAVYAERIVDHFGLRGFFTAVYGAELSGERSVKAELIAHALERERVAASQACMIGDREHDITGAAAHAGMVGLGVLWGYGTRDELEQAGASAIVERVEALRAAVQRFPAPSV